MKNITSVLLPIFMILGFWGALACSRLSPEPKSAAGTWFRFPSAAVAPEGLDPEARLDQLKRFSWQVYDNGVKTDDFKRGYRLWFNTKGDYAEYPLVTAFRGGNFHDRPYYGRPKVTQEKLAIVWTKSIGGLDKWTGVGWNGQPSVVKWDEGIKKRMNLNPGKKEKPGLKEVIYGTLDGHIYFLDLEDGLETRRPIWTGKVIKGSVAVDPSGRPLLAVGPGISGPDSAGFRIYSLLDQRQLFALPWYDNQAKRGWGANDSTGLINPAGDTFVQCGENGAIYTGKLNTVYDRKAGAISLSPQIVKFVYTHPFGRRLGIENAPAAYGNLLYAADNGGFLFCLDLNTMRPVWGRDVTDDTDASIVIDVERGGTPFLYTACEVDDQGGGGFSYIRKINGLTGKLIWENKISCAYDPEVNGGALATPVVGRGEIERLVIFNIAKTGNRRAGKMLAYRKTDGGLVWELDLPSYCWSSPAIVYAKSGRPYLIQCDAEGRVFLIDAKRGEIKDTIRLNGNVEGSPVIFEDMAVVGTRGQMIYGIRLL